MNSRLFGEKDIRWKAASVKRRFGEKPLYLYFVLSAAIYNRDVLAAITLQFPEDGIPLTDFK